jgi:fibronectin-binding autotransporter adhesin
VTDSVATPVTVTAGANNLSSTFSGTLVNGAGSLGLTKAGTGTLTLSGANTYSGATTVSAGTLQAGSTTAFSANSAFVVTSTVDLNGFSNSVGSLAGAGTVTSSVATLVTVTAGVNNTSTTFSGTLVNGAGTIGLTKTGTGTLTLSGANTYSGVTTVSAGTLQAGSTTAFSGNSAFMVTSTLDLKGFSDTLGSLAGTGTVTNSAGSASANLTVGGNNTSTTFSGNLINGVGMRVTKTGTGTLTLSGANTYGGFTTVSAGTLQAGSTTGFSANSAFVVTSTLDLNGFSSSVGSLAGAGTVTDSVATPVTVTAGANNLSSTFSGTLVNGAGSLGLTKAGTGTLTMSGANTYSGATTVSAGTLQAGSVTAFSASSAFTVNSALDLASFSDTVGSLAGTGTVTNSAATTSATLTAGGNNTSTTFSGTLTNGAGTLGLTKTGSGTLTLFGADTYSSATTVSAGTLQAGSITAFSASSAFTVTSALDLNGFSNSVGSLAGAGTVTDSVATPVTVTAGANNTSTTFSGTIVNGAGSLGLTKTGTGTLTLSGANTYGGATTVSAGTLQAGSVTAFSASSAFTVNSTLDLASFSNTTGSLAGTGTVTNMGGGSATLTTGVDNSSTVFNGTLTEGSFTLGLTKLGTGALTLAGANTYTGATNVDGGILRVTGSLGSTSVTVASGGTLAGSGTIAGPVNILNGGILAPGDPATLTVGPLTLNSGSILNYQLGTPNVAGSGTNDLVQVNGNLILAGTLDVTNEGGFGEGVYRLFNYSGSLTNDGLSFGTLPTGFTPSDMLIQTSQAGQINLVVSASGFTDQFWDGGKTMADGAIHGASGTWDNTTTNWTNQDATANANWQGGFAIFAGTAGTVSLGANINSIGMEFMTNGYLVTASGSETLILAPGSIIRVDPGVAATIAVPMVNGVQPASMTKTDLGTLILTGSNTYTGGTTISLGTLQLGKGGSTGSIVGNVVDNSNLAFNRSDVVTFSGNVSGTGTLSQLGPGTLTLTGSNNYSGGTIITGGTLSVDTDAELGDPSGGITLAGGELLTTISPFSTARTVDVSPSRDPNILAALTFETATYTGILSGTGALIVGDNTNTGTVVLTATNTYSGGTTITGGTLQIGDGGISGSILGNVIDNSNFALSRSDVVTFSGNVSGPGTLSQLGPGTLILTGANSYSGGTIIRGGTLSVDTDAELGAPSGGVTFLAGELLTTGKGFNSARAVDLDSGKFAQTLAAATGTTATYNGVLSSGGGPFGAALTIGDGTNDGTVVLANGANTYSGGTNVLVGASLSVDTDAELGNSSGGIMLTGGELLTTQNGFSSARAVTLNTSEGTNILAAVTGTRATYTGVFSGDGGLAIGDGTHAGTVVLAGSNIYSGGTVIELGTLLVDNAQALGTGDVLLNGGVLGADPQPINVLGNYTQNAGGTLQLSIAGRAAGQFDVLNVAGNAALNGTLQLLNLGYHPQGGDQLRLIKAGGAVLSRFSQFENPFLAGLGFNTVDLVYARKSVTLEFLELATPVIPLPPGTPGTPTRPTVVITTDFSSFALTPNQTAAGNLLDAVQLDPRAANLISFLNTEPFANLPNDLQKFSPDGLTAFYEISFSNANIQKLNLESRLDDIHNGSTGFSSNMKVNGATVNLEDRADADGKSSKAVVEPILQPGPQNRWGVWVTGFGDFVNVDGDGNAQGYNFTTGGVSLGLDYRITDQLAIGVMGEYSHTWTDLNPGGHIDVDSGRGGVYATWFSHGFYINGSIYGGHNNYDSGRADLQGLATGSTEGSEWSTFIGGGYDFRIAQLTVGPIASLQYTDVGIDSFDEKGSLAPLNIHSGSAESLRSDVGFRAFYQWQIGKLVVEPSLKAAWEHEYKYSALPITAGFAGIPGPSATFFGPSEGHDSAIVSAGVSVQVTPAITTYVNYDGQLGRGNYDSNAVTGGIRISF